MTSPWGVLIYLILDSDSGRGRQFKIIDYREEKRTKKLQKGSTLRDIYRQSSLPSRSPIFPIRGFPHQRWRTQVCLSRSKNQIHPALFPSSLDDGDDLLRRSLSFHSLHLSARMESSPKRKELCLSQPFKLWGLVFVTHHIMDCCWWLSTGRRMTSITCSYPCLFIQLYIAPCLDQSSEQSLPPIPIQKCNAGLDAWEKNMVERGKAGGWGGTQYK